MNFAERFDLNLGSGAFKRLTSALNFMYISSGALKAAFACGLCVVV